MDSNYLKQSLSQSKKVVVLYFEVGLSFCSSSFVERKKIPIVSTADMGSEGQTSAPFCVCVCVCVCVFKQLLRGKRKQRKVQGSNPWTWKRTVPYRLKPQGMLYSTTYWQATIIITIFPQNKILQTKQHLFQAIFYSIVKICTNNIGLMITKSKLDD